MKRPLLLFAVLAVFLAESLPLRADPTTVTVTARAPLETLGAGGSITAVAMAAPGTHYTLVNYLPVGTRGTPAVIIADKQNQQYRIDLAATDYTPPPAATATGAGRGANAFAASVSTPVKVGGLSFPELPPAVQKTIQSQLNGRTVGDITRVDDAGDISYELEMKAPTGSRGLTVARDGKLLSTEVVLAELPTDVLTAIKTAVGQGKLEGIEKRYDGGETTYVADITINGHPHDFTFQENGTLASVGVEATDLPPAVLKTLKTAAAWGKLEGIEKRYDGGETTYVAGITTNGKEHDFIFREDGTLASVGVEMTDLPIPVLVAVKAAVGQGKLDGVEKKYDEGTTTYVAGITINGHPHDFTFQENGTLASVGVEMTDLPPAVQTAISTNLDKGKLQEIDKEIENGATTYTAGISTNGTEHHLTFGEDGTLLSQEVTLAETPSSVKTTITNTIGDGKIIEIDFASEDGKHVYEVEGRKDGKPFRFSVGPKGKFLGMDD